jgi:hypothetical protein
LYFGGIIWREKKGSYMKKIIRFFGFCIMVCVSTVLYAQVVSFDEDEAIASAGNWEICYINFWKNEGVENEQKLFNFGGNRTCFRWMFGQCGG